MKTSLKLRLMLAFSIIGVVPALIVALGTFQTASQSLEEYVFAKLTNTRDVMKVQIGNYFDIAQKDVEILADSKDVEEFYKTAQVYKKLEEVGELDDLDVSTYEYNEYWQFKGKALNELVNVKGYGDVLLITADTGHVVYSAKKNADYGKSLKRLSDTTSPLYKVWQSVVSSRGTQFQDFLPYKARGDRPTAFVAAPVVNIKKQVVAVIVLQLSLQSINDVVGQRSGMGESGENYLVGPDNLMRSDSYLAPDKFSVVTSFARGSQGRAESDAISKALAGNSGTEITSSYLGDKVLTAYTPVSFGGLTWALMAEVSESEAFHAVDEILLTVAVILLVILLIVIGVALYMSTSITAPVEHMTKFLDQLALGRVHTRTGIVRQDEIGRMARSLDNLADYLDQTLIKGLKNIAEGDLSQTVTPKDSQDDISHALIKTNDDLAGIVHEISGLTNNLVSQSDKIMSASDNISNSADYSQNALETISVALLEVGRVAENTADKTVEADNLGMSAAESASQGRAQVEEAVTAMQEIKVATDNISSILVAIESIADQTNLLALNAAIEAARAGESGRGFAVVADEVRTLASQSTQAATETAELVKLVVEKTEVGATITQTSADSLAHIVEAVEQVSNIMGDISRSTTEQSHAVNEVNENLLKIADVNKETSMNAQQGQEVSLALSSFSNGLKAIVNRFTLKS